MQDINIDNDEMHEIGEENPAQDIVQQEEGMRERIKKYVCSFVCGVSSLSLLLVGLDYTSKHPDKLASTSAFFGLSASLGMFTAYQHIPWPVCRRVVFGAAIVTGFFALNLAVVAAKDPWVSNENLRI